jgi:diguanylate cyclase (GGDEF)-like protein
MDATSRPTPTPPSASADVARTTKRSPLVERRRTSPALAAFVAATIVAGVAALGWATLTLPLAPGIATDGLMHIAADDRVSGLLFWIAFGLLGSARTKGYGGHAVLTFHLPFIVAAMVLGGPVAGGWVAAIATIELRELREAPWFGTLSNHAIVTLAAVIGGLVVAELRGTLGAVLDPSLAMLAAAACGALVLCAIDVGLSATTIALREGLGHDELGSVYNSSFRQTLGAEVVLGWLLAVVYVAIAWWAPIACFLIVLIVWRANDEHELTTHDSMTGLLNRRGFDERYAATVRRVRHGHTLAAVLMIDLDKFKAVNDTLGHAAGDEVLKQVAHRLRDAVRYTDVAARLGGDEFAVLLARVADQAGAERVALRIHERLCEPLVIGGHEVAIGASLGLILLDRDTAPDALATADRAMYDAKEGGGGFRSAAMA